MLDRIHVKNMALIDEAEVSFGEQLNILTGETGAGKSVVIGSAFTALGGKVSKDSIRRGCDYALAELDFAVTDPEVIKALLDMDVAVEDGHVVISRRITPTRSVARINGELVSAGVLKTVGAMLIDIHGQHEHQSLIHKEKHLEILDRYAFAGDSGILEELKAAYQTARQLEQERDEAREKEAGRQKEMDFLAFQIDEIDQARLVDGEEEELDKAFRRMSHARQMMENVTAAHEMTGYEGRAAAGDLVGRALKELYPIEKYDEGVSNLIAQLSDIDALLNDFNRELAIYQDSLTFDESEYQQTEQRLNLIEKLKRKYGRDISEILSFRDQAGAELEKLSHYEAYLAELERRCLSAEKALHELSGKVSHIRQEVAREMGERIMQALLDLNFLQVQFKVDIKPLGRITGLGEDDVTFIISTNPGEEMKPLGSVASGGELSRIMLAIKSVLADSDRIETLIFDEIDTGISGRTAQKVAEKMAGIADRHQVICITHLPQIAAMADSHFLIEKTTEDLHTKTMIRALSDEERVTEVARLLGGARITDAVLSNAREMIDLASVMKQ